MAGGNTKSNVGSGLSTAGSVASLAGGAAAAPVAIPLAVGGGIMHILGAGDAASQQAQAQQAQATQQQMGMDAQMSNQASQANPNAVAQLNSLLPSLSVAGLSQSPYG